MFSCQGVVGGLWGSSGSNEPRVFSGCALKPFFGISIPALVSNPILSRSRRLNPAAISSERLFAAVWLSFSFRLFRLEIYAIGRVLLLNARARLPRAVLLRCIGREFGRYQSFRRINIYTG